MNGHRLIQRALRIVAILALILGFYLLAIAWSQRGLPLGCGDAGGCAEVFRSRWSKVWGVPVSLAAIPVYLSALILSWMPARRWVSHAFIFIATVCCGAAVWFLFLQVVRIQAICPWCMTEHVLGVLLAGLAIAESVLRSRELRRRELPRDRPSRAHFGTAIALALGCLSVVGFAFVQDQWSSSSTVRRLPEGANGDTGRGDDRQVSVLQGDLTLSVVDEPLIGARDADHLICVMFDYCCPHCRRAHEYLLKAQHDFSPQLAIICLPAPRDHDCNPSLAETEPRFEHACELAELALAVWIAQPESFPEFDRWLFETERPADPAAARAQAVALVSEARLQAALTDVRVREKIARNVAAFERRQLEYLPVILSPGLDAVIGRPESEDELKRLLRDGLSLR